MATYKVMDKVTGRVLAKGLDKAKALWLVRAWGAVMEEE